MRIRPGNAQHQGAREYQEDSFAFSDVDDAPFAAHGGVLAVIADGMGGLSHGAEASAAAVRAFVARYRSKTANEPIADALSAALACANTAVCDLAERRGAVGGVGTTLTAVVVHDQQLYWTSVGDSRAYLVRGGRVEQITLDHVYAVDLDRLAAAGALSEEHARTDPDRDRLISHLGQERLAAIDRSEQPFPLDTGDRVLLCTDGVYRAVTPVDLAARLTGDPQQGCDDLVRHVVRQSRPGQDNLTAIALALGGADRIDDAPPATESARDSGAPALLMAAATAILILLTAGFWWRRHVPAKPVVKQPAAHFYIERPQALIDTGV